MDESVNLPGGGNETVQPSADLDNPANWNFAEPDDDEANQEQQESGIESETDATADNDDGQESDEPNDAEESQDDENQSGADLDENAVVTLKDGEKVPVKELKLGYMRERDYRIKTQDVANKGRTLDQLSNRVANTAQQIASFLANQLPDEPSPQLAMTNPGEYTRQKAMFDVAMQQVNQILAMGGEPKQVSQQLTTEQQNQKLSEENQKLIEAFPEVAKPEGREKFFQNAFATGRDLGFSEEEMAGFDDHRYLKVIHYARLGLAAEQAKAKVMQKMNNAPPPVVKGKAQNIGAVQHRQNKEAMQRLSKTGSIKDAVLIDFD